MSDPFTRHGIRHLSPSSLNTFKAEPAFWVAKYLFGVKDEFKPSAKRGVAVEAGLDAWLYNRDLDLHASMTLAVKNFALNTDGLADDDHERQRALIGPMLSQATKALEALPSPTARQVKIEHWFDGVEVPVIGYADYEWPEFGLDLKTTERCPSAPKGDHKRQISLYAAARQKPFRLLYVTPKKFEIYPKAEEADAFEAECADALRDMRRIARSLRKMLAASRSREEAAEFQAPDFDAFYWDANTKQAAQAIWA